MRFSLSQLPPHLRKQAEAQLFPTQPPSQPPRTTHPPPQTPQNAEIRPSAASASSRPTSTRARKGTPRKPVLDAFPTTPPLQTEGDFVEHSPKSSRKPPLVDHSGEPNRTEARYNREILHGNGRYEPITLRLPGGNYTPDWMTIDDGVVTFHEVKGAFRFGSQSRAILGFKSAAAMFPFWNFVWATLKKGGVWDIKKFEPKTIGDESDED